MTGLFEICAVCATIAVIVATVFLVRTLIQIRRTAREAEQLLHNLNREIDVVARLTGALAGLADKLSSPWLRAGTWIGGLASAFIKKHRRSSAESDDEE